MSKKVLYYSKDKLYKMKKRKKKKKLRMTTLCIVATIVLVLLSLILFRNSIVLKSQEASIQYNEIGKADYKVYLKDNDFYDSSFLPSGMQYVANLVKTINVKFNYEIHTTEDLDFVNEYKVVSELQITEKNDPTRILYSKKNNIIPSKMISMFDDNLVINDEVDIDYDKYNNIVNDYKKNLGLIVSSNLILTFDANTNASTKSDELEKNNKLQVMIPLSESTLKISNNNINNTDAIKTGEKLINVENEGLFVLAFGFFTLTIVMLILDIYVYCKTLEKNPYKTKLNNILKNYDRLIVTGNVDIDESKYSNITYANTFKELVDAAQNFGVPIMHYEVIAGEKSIFVASKDDTLVKYRVTKAYLNNKKNKEEKITK